MSESHKKYVIEARYFDGLVLHVGWALMHLRERDPNDPRIEDMYKYLRLMLQSKYDLEEKDVTS